MDRTARDECKPFVTKDGSEIREILAYRNSGCERTSLAEATLYEGQSTSPHSHPVTEEIYYILKGRGRIRVGDETGDLAPGDAVLLPPGVIHEAWNTEPDPLVFLCICAPAYEHDDTEMEERTTTEDSK